MPRVVLLLALAASLGCSKRPDEPSSPPRPSSPHGAASSSHGPGAAPSLGASTVGLNLQWSDPPGWQRRPGSNPMRKFEYTVPHAPADQDDGELIVTSFGQGQGGSVEENIDRWVRQFQPDGKSTGQQSKRQVSGFKVSLVEVEGEYKPMALPGAPPPTKKANHRLLGAIVETPSTMWFFKMIGPDETVKNARSAFHSMIDSIRP